MNPGLSKSGTLLYTDYDYNEVHPSTDPTSTSKVKMLPINFKGAQAWGVAIQNIAASAPPKIFITPTATIPSIVQSHPSDLSAGLALRSDSKWFHVKDFAAYFVPGTNKTLNDFGDVFAAAISNSSPDEILENINMFTRAINSSMPTEYQHDSAGGTSPANVRMQAIDYLMHANAIKYDSSQPVIEGTSPMIACIPTDMNRVEANLDNLCFHEEGHLLRSRANGKDTKLAADALRDAVYAIAANLQFAIDPENSSPDVYVRMFDKGGRLNSHIVDGVRRYYRAESTIRFGQENDEWAFSKTKQYIDKVSEFFNDSLVNSPSAGYIPLSILISHDNYNPSALSKRENRRETAFDFRMAPIISAVLEPVANRIDQGALPKFADKRSGLDDPKLAATYISSMQGLFEQNYDATLEMRDKIKDGYLLNTKVEEETEHHHAGQKRVLLNKLKYLFAAYSHKFYSENNNLFHGDATSSEWDEATSRSKFPDNLILYELLNKQRRLVKMLVVPSDHLEAKRVVEKIARTNHFSATVVDLGSQTSSSLYQRLKTVYSREDIDFINDTKVLTNGVNSLSEAPTLSAVSKEAKAYVKEPLKNAKTAFLRGFDKTHAQVEKEHKQAETDNAMPEDEKTLKEVYKKLDELVRASDTTTKIGNMRYTEAIKELKDFANTLFNAHGTTALGLSALSRIGEFKLKNSDGTYGRFVFGPGGDLYAVNSSHRGVKTVIPVPAMPFNNDSVYMRTLFAIRDSIRASTTQEKYSVVYKMDERVIDSDFSPDQRRKYVEWVSDLEERIQKLSQKPYKELLNAVSLTSFLARDSQRNRSMYNYDRTNDVAYTGNVLGQIPAGYKQDIDFERDNAKIISAHNILREYLYKLYARKAAEGSWFLNTYNADPLIKERVNRELAMRLEQMEAQMHDLSQKWERGSAALTSIIGSKQSTKEMRDFLKYMDEEEAYQPTIFEKLVGNFTSMINSAWETFSNTIFEIMDALTNVDRIFKNFSKAFENAVISSTKVFFSVLFSDFATAHFKTKKVKVLQAAYETGMDTFGIHKISPEDRRRLRKVIAHSEAEKPDTIEYKRKDDMLHRHLDIDIDPTRPLSNRNITLGSKYARAFNTNLVDIYASPSMRPSDKTFGDITMEFTVDTSAALYDLGYDPAKFRDNPETFRKWWLTKSAYNYLLPIGIFGKDIPGVDKDYNLAKRAQMSIDQRFSDRVKIDTADDSKLRILFRLSDVGLSPTSVFKTSAIKTRGSSRRTAGRAFSGEYDEYTTRARQGIGGQGMGQGMGQGRAAGGGGGQGRFDQGGPYGQRNRGGF